MIKDFVKFNWVYPREKGGGRVYLLYSPCKDSRDVVYVLDSELIELEQSFLSLGENNMYLLYLFC